MGLFITMKRGEGGVRFGRRRDGNMRSYAPNQGKFQFPQFCTLSFAEVTVASNASSPKSRQITSRLYESSCPEDGAVNRLLVD